MASVVSGVCRPRRRRRYLCRLRHKARRVDGVASSAQYRQNVRFDLFSPEPQDRRGLRGRPAWRAAPRGLDASKESASPRPARTFTSACHPRLSSSSSHSFSSITSSSFPQPTFSLPSAPPLPHCRRLCRGRQPKPYIHGGLSLQAGTDIMQLR
eukprot:2089039-Pleurochrysis_carterae.AAC.1